LNARALPRFSAAAILALAAFIAPLPSNLLSQAPQNPALTVLSKDGRRPLPLVILSDQEFVALEDLAAAFQLAVHEEAFGALTVSYKGKTIVLTPDQTLASVSGRLISLPAPPTRSGRRWVVPVEFISRALAPIYDSRLDLRKPSRLLITGDLRVPRIAVRYDPLGTAGRLTIDATPRATTAVTQDAQRLVVKIDADALDLSSALPTPSDQNLIQSVRAVDATTLAVELGPRFGSFRAASQPVDTTLRTIIDITAAQTTEQPAAPAAPPPAQAPELPPTFLPPTSPLRTIAIDPGHGGENEGVKGGGGAKEKDLTLSVSRRVKATIEGRLGIRVILTRDDDRNVPIDDRTAIANNNKADLFISLHANGSMRPSTSGATIFSAAFDGAAQAAAIAGGVERVPTFGGGLRDIELVRWDLAQTRHVDQSNAFAALLEQQFNGRIPLARRPSDVAPLRVLETANMPAVLIEMGYLTNSEQEKLLVSDVFQNAVVQSVYDAIIRFRDALAAGGTR
jgi:N-acetylmuramoyl-L-alanine amidase